MAQPKAKKYHHWGDGTLESEEKLRESYGNDRIALSVVSALIMTASIAALAVSVDDFNAENGDELNETLMRVYVAFHSISIGSSVSTIFTGTWQYLKLNMAPAAAIDEMIHAFQKYPGIFREPVVYCNLSVVSCIAGVVTGVYLVYGVVAFRIALIIAIIFFIQTSLAVTFADKAFKDVVLTGKYKERESKRKMDSNEENIMKEIVQSASEKESNQL